MAVKQGVGAQGKEAADREELQRRKASEVSLEGQWVITWQIMPEEHPEKRTQTVQMLRSYNRAWQASKTLRLDAIKHDRRVLGER